MFLGLNACICRGISIMCWCPDAHCLQQQLLLPYFGCYIVYVLHLPLWPCCLGATTLSSIAAALECCHHCQTTLLTATIKSNHTSLHHSRHHQLPRPLTLNSCFAAVASPPPCLHPLPHGLDAFQHHHHHTNRTSPPIANSSGCSR
jgi:hypothetical protein